MSKPLSFDFEDALAEREAEGLAKGKAEGIQQGKAEGIQQGKAEGIQQGKAEGIQQGENEGRRKVALRMLKAKMSDADIQRLTKLTKRELELLKKRL